jgi:hypothetical protein
MSITTTGALAVLPLLLVGSAGCMSWHRASDPVPAVLERRPTVVRVVRADNAVLEIRRPRLEGDSIVGWTSPTASRDGEGTHAAVAVADIKELAVRGLNGGRSIALVAGVGATAILIAAAVSGDAERPAPSPDPCPGCVPSCPLVYSWDGHRWRLDSGTFGGAILPTLARTDLDNLDFAVPDGDSVRLRVTNELPEDDHIDALGLLAVDHDPGVSIAPDPDGSLHTVGRLAAPIAAQDFAGREVDARLARPDGWGWESAPVLRDTASQSRDGVILRFTRQAGSDSARLVLDAHTTPWAAHLMRALIQAHGREGAAWFDSLAADPVLARRMGAAIAAEAFLTVSAWTGKGWEAQGLAWEAGPEVSKRQIIPLDLRRVPGDTIRIRLESAPGLWLIDAAALDFSVEQPIVVHDLRPARAMDAAGRDIRPLIDGTDGREYVTALGDAAEVAFAVPGVVTGKARSYLLRSTGWYRIHALREGAPDRAALGRVGGKPGAISRLATSRLNAAIVAAGHLP